MTKISINVPSSMRVYREHLSEFIGTMMRKLDMNSHKNVPETKDIPGMVQRLKEEIEEFEEQQKFDPTAINNIMELVDASNFAFLAFVALRNNGVKTRKELILEEYYTVCPKEGEVYCKRTRAGSIYKVGDRIKGTKRNGCINIKIQRHGTGASVTVPRSHIIWYSHYGKWPIGVLDHKNGIMDDDRISNLKDVSFTENDLNENLERKLPYFVTKYESTSKRHSKHCGKYVYQRPYEGTNIRCAYYNTPEEAETKGYEEWKKKIKKMDGSA